MKSKDMTYALRDDAQAHSWNVLGVSSVSGGARAPSLNNETGF